jgi:hypothetical protein
MLSLLAYVVGFIVIAPLGSLVGVIVGFGALFKKFEGWFFVSGFIGAVVSLLVLRLWFNWLEVPFHWWSYIICMVSVILYEGQRAAAGNSPLYATGTLFGILASVYWGFISPISVVSMQ